MTEDIQLNDFQTSYIAALVKHRKGITADDLAVTTRRLWKLPLSGKKIHQVVRLLKSKVERGKPNKFDHYWSDSLLDEFKKAHLDLYSILYKLAMGQTNSDQQKNLPANIRDFTIVEQMNRAGLLDKEDPALIPEIEEPDDEDAHAPPGRQASKPLLLKWLDESEEEHASSGRRKYEPPTPGGPDDSARFLIKEMSCIQMRSNDPAPIDQFLL
ncbi:MAG: hypothetical protein Q9216_005347 [Gyalolechia sp. 2 TL-2023]